MNQKKIIRKLIMDLLSLFLNNETYRNLLIRDKYKNMGEIIFDHLLRWFPQISNVGRDSYGLDIIGLIENHNITNDAKKILENGIRHKLSIKELRKLVHYEHNQPVDVIKKKFIGLLSSDSVSIEQISTILINDFEVIIISKDQEKKLRANKLSKKGNFLQRMKVINDTFCSKAEVDKLIQKLKSI